MCPLGGGRGRRREEEGGGSGVKTGGKWRYSDTDVACSAAGVSSCLTSTVSSFHCCSCSETRTQHRADQLR